MKYPEHSPRTRHSPLFHSGNSSVNGKALGSFCPLCPPLCPPLCLGKAVSGPGAQEAGGQSRTNPGCVVRLQHPDLNLPQGLGGHGFVGRPLGLGVCHEECGGLKRDTDSMTQLNQALTGCRQGAQRTPHDDSPTLPVFQPALGAGRGSWGPELGSVSLGSPLRTACN